MTENGLSDDVREVQGAVFISPPTAEHLWQAFGRMDLLLASTDAQGAAVHLAALVRELRLLRSRLS